MVESLFWNLGHQSHSPTLILAGGIFDTAASSESFCNGFLLSLYLSVPSDHLPLSQKKQQFRPNSNQANKVN